MRVPVASPPRPSPFASTIATVLALLLVALAPLSAQGGTPFLLVRDALGLGSAGDLSSRWTLSQTFELSVGGRIYGNHGAMLSAVRIQDIIPVSGAFSDTGHNPEGDGLILSYAAIGTPEDPRLLTFGGGMLRRPGLTPSEHRDTWVAEMGVTGSGWELPFNSALVLGGRFLIMPGMSTSNVYMFAITGGLRFPR